MPQFRYVARNSEGKLLDGVVTCNDRAAAIRQVEQQQCVPIRIESVAAPADGNGTAEAPNKPPAEKPGSAPPVEVMSHAQQYLFTEQLANLVGAGITLDEALGILVRRMKQPRLHGVSQGLHQALVDGRSLSQALRDYPRIFSPLYVNMVAAGEASGALGDILKRLVTHLSDIKGLRDRVQQALLYPALLIVVGIILVFVFMTQMVPKLIGFFKDTGQDLPSSTRALIQIDHLFVSYWWLAILGVFGGFSLFKVLTRSKEGRKAWDTFLWRLPLYSLVIRYRFYAQFARTLGTLVENGVTLLRALELLEDISGNEFVRQKMVAIRKAVVDGATLSNALAEQRLFPELFTDMISVGEQTGRFGQSMGNIAEIYERELDKQVQVISTLVPPLVMIGIASVVGFLVYGIMTAVFSMTKGLHGAVH
jgi:type II secretory pathway component PulF